MLLQDKNAVIYGGGGAIGGAVARTFGREGARVFLAGRTLSKLEAVADDIRSAGGQADSAEVDALDEKAVDEHADAVAAEAGSLDISFNLITQPAVHGTPLADMKLDVELGRHGIRTVTLRSGGVPETLPEFEGREAVLELMEKEKILPNHPTLEDVGNVAAFVASDKARTMTVATVNVSSGALID